jgi:hypothetical protein
MTQEQDRDMGPPEKERPPRFPNRQGPNRESATTTDEPKTTTQHRQPPLTDQWVDAGRNAAVHILCAGFTPRLEPEVLRALHSRGGFDRSLAEVLHAVTGGEIR